MATNIMAGLLITLLPFMLVMLYEQIDREDCFEFADAVLSRLKELVTGGW